MPKNFRTSTISQQSRIRGQQNSELQQHLIQIKNTLLHQLKLQKFLKLGLLLCPWTTTQPFHIIPNLIALKF